MPDFAAVEAFGKAVFTPADGGTPELPELNVLVFRSPEGGDIYSHTAVCVQLDLDACGSSAGEAEDGLLKAIQLYFDAQARHCSSAEEFVRRIIAVAYEESPEKERLFRMYRTFERQKLEARAGKNSAQFPRSGSVPSLSSMFLDRRVELSPVMAKA